jgi:hypothetical protein
MIKSLKNNCLGLILISGMMFMTSCATIIGGSKYFANVTVKDHPNATIIYKNGIVGKGTAIVKVPRKEADKLYFELKEEGCKTQIDSFNSRNFRVWAFLGTVVTWTGLINGVPLPWGIATDGITGALWKPDVNEEGVSKIDIKHYNYMLKYTGCDTKK